MTLIGESGSAVAPWPGTGRLSWALRTDTGLRRAVNEDSAVALGAVFAVADGMGGHAAGDRASEAVVDALAELAALAPVDASAAADAATGDTAPTSSELAESAVMSALRSASERIESISEEIEADAGTTATGLVPIADELPAWLVFNVGDSRVYRLHDDELEQVTVDHSLVQLLVDEGAITAAQAEHHPEANVVTRALGFGEPPDPDFFRVPAVIGDRMLLCSDGLTKEVDVARLRELLLAPASLEEIASSLVEAALAAGGHDNITVLLVELTD